jgi:hypothetical protein
MGKFFGFHKKDKKKKKKESMWEMMQKMSQDFKEQERKLVEQRERIEQKRKDLEARGIDVDTSHIKKDEPDSTRNNTKRKQTPLYISKDELSMWEMMELMASKFAEEKSYMDQLEKAYDEALAKEEVVVPKEVQT